MHISTTPSRRWLRPRWLLGAALLGVAALAGCGGDDSETTGPAGGSSSSQGGSGGTTSTGGAGGQSPGPPIEFLGFEGDHGDVGVRFALHPPDGEPRELTLSYLGCTAEDWRTAIVADDASVLQLEAGEHLIAWASWEQEAGCVDTVELHLETDRAEGADTGPLDLHNEGQDSGFLEMPAGPQGIDDTELDRYAQALAVLLAAPGVDFVATRIGDRYEAHAARGSVAFQRVRTLAGTVYEVLEVEGTNPIGVQDPTLFPTRALELARGGNPNEVSYPSLGFDDGDERLSFIEPEDDSYPYAYERLAAYFDHPNAADLMVNPLGYGRHDIHAGEHGSMAMVQSRCPLIVWGKGIAPGEKTMPARQVDLAPTVMKLLGGSFTEGVDERGIRSHHVYLAWQDGHVLEELLDGTQAEHALIVVSDGLNATALYDKIASDPEAVPTLARLVSEGAWLPYGTITNWPSVTYPSHNVIGSGLWSGHHGLVDNTYYRRDADDIANPIHEIFNTGHYFDPVLTPGETLHHAVHRSFGDWKDDMIHGAYTLSAYDPSVAGANTADLELHDDSGQISFPLDTLLPPWETPWPNVSPLSVDVFASQLSERYSMAEVNLVFDNTVTPKPRYTILNLPSSDVMGHNEGPHGNQIDAIIEHFDENLGTLVDWLDELGALESTAIFVTSDHGMQLQDESRSGDFKTALADVGISIVAGTSAMGVYFQ